jgi:hypothetical protein
MLLRRVVSQKFKDVSDVFTAKSMKMTVFLNITPCILLEIGPRFRDRYTYCLHHQGGNEAIGT